MTGVAIDALAYALVLGISFGVGVCLLVSVAPRWGAPSLARRIAPYIRDVTDPRGTSLPLPGRAWGAQEMWRSAAQTFSRFSSGSEVTQLRLRQAGCELDLAGFRGRQLGWAVAGVAVGAVLLVVLALAGRGGPAVWLLPVVGAAAGALGCDIHLTRAARARVARIEEELATVLEFIALCLAAGEGIHDALRRVSALGAGDLTSELRGVVVEVGTGSPLATALGGLAGDLEIAALSRAIDQIVAALERGAPLAQVLHGQAADAREQSKRALIEQAGRKEIAMLVPYTIAKRCYQGANAKRAHLSARLGSERARCLSFRPGRPHQQDRIPSPAPA
ncbi:type II secretion system F family protein [Microbacterium hominis]|uniref:Type II secretion system F family protein n=1 Tax=Microbacterium hominis TaxID=162426 RepID=A0A7D4TQK4_9MICO|nr:type II secretion system F family protein [Microbacterium hominis]QKJ19164.1 type II secretion system F family protein [Microbacterium hominis]